MAEVVWVREFDHHPYCNGCPGEPTCISCLDNYEDLKLEYTIEWERISDRHLVAMCPKCRMILKNFESNKKALDRFDYDTHSVEIWASHLCCESNLERSLHTPADGLHPFI